MSCIVCTHYRGVKNKCRKNRIVKNGTESFGCEDYQYNQGVKIKMSEESVEKVTKCLEELVKEKSEALNTLNIAVNEHVRLKNQYITQSNMLRIKPDQIKEDLGLSKPATEKQQQAYIDDQLKDLVQDMRIADANVSSWKREIDLLDDKIQVEKYKIKILPDIWSNLNGKS